MTGMVSADTTVTHNPDAGITYTLNEWFSTEQEFTWVGTITITDWETTITMLDRNLGATAAWTGCEDPSWWSACAWWDATYWYHFQRWNNYWFGSRFSISSTQVQATSITYNPFYTDPVFRIGNANWLNDDSVVDLWWWSTSDYIDEIDWNKWQVSNATSRQWPCPENFHVPSYGELLKIKDMMGDDASVIHSQLLVPFAGNRNFTDAEVYGLGSYVNLRSSSPLSTEDSTSRYLDLSVDGGMDMGRNRRASAYSLRCVYDSYETYTPAWNLSSEGGDTSGQVTLTLTAWENTCTLNDYNLGTHDASTVNQYVESSGQEIMCEFLQNSWVGVLLSMNNLADWEKIIWAENFTWIVTASGDALWSISNLIWWSYNLSWTKEIYWKSMNTIWKWIWDLQIQWIIPAWTPSGTYTWTLEIVIQAWIFVIL